MSQPVFEPIYPNPYIAGNPIRSQEMFFGRVDEFRFIARALEDGSKAALIVLFGERRSGKSSILYQILNGKLGETFLPIFIDMQIMAGITCDADFYGRIIIESCKQLNKNGMSPEPHLSKLTSLGPANGFRQFLHEVRNHFPQRALLLLLDEYEILEIKINESALSRDLLTFFAGLLETDQVSFVFTGSKSLEARDQKLWGEDLFRKATSHKISFLTRDDTTRLVTEPLQGKVIFAPDVVTQIYVLTAGQPFYTQMICQNLVYHLNEVQRRHATLDDLQTVVNGVLENPPPQLIFNWSEHTSQRKLTLSLLGEFSEAPATFLSGREIAHKIKRQKLVVDLDANFFNTELSSLVRDEYVLEDGHRKFGFRLDLYRRWVRHDHNIWQVKTEIGAQELARITKTERKRREVKKKVVRRLEHALATALALAVVIVVTLLLFERQKHVIVRANGGPFLVLVDGDTAGTSKGEEDSTRFRIPHKLTKGKAHEFKVILQASNEVQARRDTIEKDDQQVSFEFRQYPITFVTDAASIEAKLGGLKAETERGQDETWQHTFQVCAGTYQLWAKDPGTGEEKNSIINVPDAANPVKIDFDSVVVMTLGANQYPFEYGYERGHDFPRSKRNLKLARADSAIVLRGLPKSYYRFVFFNPVTKQRIQASHSIQTDTTITAAFETATIAVVTSKPPAAVLTPTIVSKQKLRIDAEPQGALVSLDGVPRSETPFLENLEPGSYSIVLTRDGYDHETREIYLVQDTTVLIKLSPQFGMLILVVQDEHGRSLPDVSIYVDGEFKGVSPRLKELRLLAIPHMLRLECLGYLTNEITHVIKKDVSERLVISMQRKR